METDSQYNNTLRILTLRLVLCETSVMTDVSEYTLDQNFGMELVLQGFEDTYYCH